MAARDYWKSDRIFNNAQDARREFSGWPNDEDAITDAAAFADGRIAATLSKSSFELRGARVARCFS